MSRPPHGGNPAREQGTPRVLLLAGLRIHRGSHLPVHPTHGRRSDDARVQDEAPDRRLQRGGLLGALDLRTPSPKTPRRAMAARTALATRLHGAHPAGGCGDRAEYGREEARPGGGWQGGGVWRFGRTDCLRGGPGRAAAPRRRRPGGTPSQHGGSRALQPRVRSKMGPGWAGSAQIRHDVPIRAKPRPQLVLLIDRAGAANGCGGGGWLASADHRHRQVYHVSDARRRDGCHQTLPSHQVHPRWRWNLPGHSGNHAWLPARLLR
mmetsp:Transcript_2933/g.6509  ORF Transcript_2933/g.6509 Transcript_2933/m.6509 type:complete len:265 (+) Transcript_2933:389-1183(+)